MKKSKKNKKIFMDYASITPIDEKVAKKISEVQRQTFVNPSALYEEAIFAKELIQESKQKIAEIFHCQKDEIIFTSGGTESNNLALMGLFLKCLETKTKKFTPHVITSKIEHPAILEVCKEIEKRGGEVTYIDVDSEGLVSLKKIRESIKVNTVLVSIAYANNEIGVIQPIHDISRIIKDWRQKNNTKFPFFHTDACQATLYLPLDVLKLGVDMMTLDGIKMYGPRATGILYKKASVELSPILFGGGQENGIRSGTENTSAVVGFSFALQIADKNREKEAERLTKIRDYAIDAISKNFPNSSLNGSKKFRLPNNVNVCFPELDAEFAVISLDVNGILASYSSSCRTLKEDSSSYVIDNLGKTGCGMSSLRFTFGRDTKKSDVNSLVKALKKIVL